MQVSSLPSKSSAGDFPVGAAEKNKRDIFYFRYVWTQQCTATNCWWQRRREKRERNTEGHVNDNTISLVDSFCQLSNCLRGTKAQRLSQSDVSVCAGFHIGLTKMSKPAARWHKPTNHSYIYVWIHLCASFYPQKIMVRWVHGEYASRCSLLCKLWGSSKTDMSYSVQAEIMENRAAQRGVEDPLSI